ncbi:glycerol-3-phosphate 1-O-acyltransferase PlsY [Amylibacter sp.]|nr:glycerol-3-phosphate 1-O-acyltransferase PlsY [Amylibacter sp.]MDA9229649.1 glycerol-3-phosphate 1-O-acyltransferase PlsY [Amylibacter sp.]MDA9242640.1 glycerol-3-phosphate 1-O-acyltransferase PlsY [Amylibacter sp.]MDA9290484.1 glycerol-3-phosphate 1-O-acyltransferase PlsY [Amylibacter sp.]MDB3878743.1 glycerol-3-phosphate 1-O-acyltransferase PlsY [Amylibacter sp.]
MLPVIEHSILNIFMIAITGYLIGSIPFGIIIAKIMGLGNLRNIGSGNIGATNVLRTGNKLAAILTLIFDLSKGAVVVILARLLFDDSAAQISGLGSFLGHCFPVWLGFKGGKGVATFIGITLALYWPAGILTCLTWISIAYISRISSLSALLSSISSIVWIWICGMPNATFIMIILTIFIWVRHKENIKRIVKNTEPRINS